MSARVYDRSEWHAARRRRAQRGKAPRLAVERGILLREAPSGKWTVGIHVKRFGIWRKPERLCDSTSFERAEAAARAAWQRLKLPLYWSQTGDRLRAYHIGVRALRAVSA